MRVQRVKGLARKVIHSSQPPELRQKRRVAPRTVVPVAPMNALSKVAPAATPDSMRGTTAAPCRRMTSRTMACEMM